MLFDVNEFEQFFTEKILSRGLKLFEKGKVELFEKPSNSIHHFVIDSETHLKIKKKADAILSYSCDCNQTKHCEHLSAAIFYFQKDILGITIKYTSTKRKNISKKNVDGASEKKMPFKHFLQKIDISQLIDFIGDYSEEHSFFKELLKVEFSERTENNAFNYYSLQIKLLLEPFLKLPKLNRKTSSEIASKFQFLLKKVAKTKSDFNALLFCRLALLDEFQTIIEKASSFADSDLEDIHKDNLQALDSYFKDGLNEEESSSWILCTELSLKSNSKVLSEVYTFLVARAACLIKKEADFLKLKTLLSKRSQKLYHTNYFNKLLIAQLQLEIKQAGQKHQSFVLKKYSEEPELAIALADLSFCEARIDQGFHHLETYYENAKQSAAFYGYLDYIISKANEFMIADIEIKYLKESFILGLNIYPNYLQRLIDLVPAEKSYAEIDDVIDKLKKKEKHFNFDKIATLLMKQGRWDEVANEIKKQQNKFSVLNIVAQKKWPHYDQEFLDLYVKHLLEAFREARVMYYQEHIFKEARKYIDKLPIDDAKKLVDTILFKMGKHHASLHFIRVYQDNLEGTRNR